jgi:hypothetical protein
MLRAKRTGDVQTVEIVQTFPPADRTGRTLFLILYPDSCEEEVVQILDSVGVPGFTETRKVTGRGQRGRHFDNSIWPGADGMIYVVVNSSQRGALASALRDYSRSLEARSRGLSGLHVFTWSCDQML